MTNEEFLQRYDSGKPNFTEDEIKDMAYEEFGNYVTTTKGKTHRCSHYAYTPFSFQPCILCI